MPSTNFIFNPPIIAHRGASALAPENTLAAFRRAKEIGASWVEFDVMLDRNGEAIVFHDEEIDRTTNGIGRVNTLDYSYLKTLDAGGWFSKEFAGEKIPTFQEVLRLLHSLNLSANIEIKSFPNLEKQTVAQVIKILNQEKPLPNFFISSFSVLALEYVRQSSSDISLGFLMHDWISDWEKMTKQLGCDFVDVNGAILNLERIQEIKRTQKKLLVYTINDLTLAKHILANGVDAIFSDCPLSMAPLFSTLV